jgi:hypothetical protein
MFNDIINKAIKPKSKAKMTKEEKLKQEVKEKVEAILASTYTPPTVKQLIEVEARRKVLGQSPKDYEVLLSDVSVLEGKTLEYIKKISIDEAKAYMVKYQPFWDMLYSQEVSNVIVVKGETYTIQSVNDITFGQYMDLEDILKRNISTPYAAMPSLLAILFNKETETLAYKANYERLSKEVLDWGFKEVIPLINFILSQGLKRLETSQPYLEAQVIEKKKQVMMELIKLETRLTAIRRGSGGITGGTLRFAIWPITKLIKYVQSRIIR